MLDARRSLTRLLALLSGISMFPIEQPIGAREVSLSAKSAVIEGTGPMPDELFGDWRESPLWLSLELWHAKPWSGSGSDPVLHLESKLAKYQGQSAENQVRVIDESIFPSDIQRDEAAIAAPWSYVLRGTITRISPGVRLRPAQEVGSLFRVEVTKSLRGSASEGDYFFFLPMGRFEYGEIQAVVEAGRMPSISELEGGVGVILLVDQIEGRYLHVVEPANLIVLREDGTARLPHNPGTGVKFVPTSHVLRVFQKPTEVDQ